MRPKLALYFGLVLTVLTVAFAAAFALYLA